MYNFEGLTGGFKRQIGLLRHVGDQGPLPGASCNAQLYLSQLQNLLFCDSATKDLSMNRTQSVTEAVLLQGPR